MRAGCMRSAGVAGGVSSDRVGESGGEDDVSDGGGLFLVLIAVVHSLSISVAMDGRPAWSIGLMCQLVGGGGRSTGRGGDGGGLAIWVFSTRGGCVTGSDRGGGAVVLVGHCSCHMGVVQVGGGVSYR